MSLPSSAIWYNGDKSIGKTFINVGWFYEESLVFEEMKRWKRSNGYPDTDWTHVEIYNKKYTKEDVEKILNEIC